MKDDSGMHSLAECKRVRPSKFQIQIGCKTGLSSRMVAVSKIGAGFQHSPNYGKTWDKVPTASRFSEHQRREKFPD